MPSTAPYFKWRGEFIQPNGRFSISRLRHNFLGAAGGATTRSGAHRCAPLLDLVFRRCQPAAVTARCAITLIEVGAIVRMSRGCRSASRRPEILTLSIAPADQFAFSAASIGPTRITPLCEAPVAATRTSPAWVLATNTPVSAKREAGWRNLA